MNEDLRVKVGSNMFLLEVQFHAAPSALVRRICHKKCFSFRVSAQPPPPPHGPVSNARSKASSRARHERCRTSPGIGHGLGAGGPCTRLHRPSVLRDGVVHGWKRRRSVSVRVRSSVLCGSTRWSEPWWKRRVGRLGRCRELDQVSLK